jgi:hypothetical protein
MNFNVDGFAIGLSGAMGVAGCSTSSWIISGSVLFDAKFIALRFSVEGALISSNNPGRS